MNEIDRFRDLGNRFFFRTFPARGAGMHVEVFQTQRLDAFALFQHRCACLFVKSFVDCSNIR